MKKRLVVLSAVAIVAAMAGLIGLTLGLWPRSAATLSYAATTAVTTTRVSGITVQNQSGSATANVTIDFYDQSGNKITNATITTQIAPSAQHTWYSPNITNLPDGFMGSAVVTSDQPVAAIVNTQTPSGVGTDSTDPARVDTSPGMMDSAVSSIEYVPQIMANYYGWNSVVYVQNTSGSAANVTFKVYDASGNVKAQSTVAIPAYSMKDFHQADENLGNTFVGSAVISTSDATQKLGVVANFYNADTSASTAQFHTYAGVGIGGTKLYAPRVVKNYYGYNSGLKVQNIDPSGPASVTVTYYIGGSAVTQNATIPPNTSWGPYLGDPNQVPSNLPDGSGSATIVSTNGKTIIASINEDNRTLGRGTTYTAFVDGTQTTEVLLPQVTSRYYGYCSGIQFQNVGNSTATGTITLKKSNGQSISISFSVDPNKSFSYFVPNVTDPSTGQPLTDFNGSAVISSSQPIVGIENLSFRGDVDPRYSTLYGDTFTMYDGFNK